MNPKQKHKAKMSALRKKMKESGYSTVKEKGYYDYSVRERANIRENAKQGSNAHKWATEGRTHKENPFKAKY